MALPWHFHGISMALPWHFHITLPWHLHATLPRYFYDASTQGVSMHFGNGPPPVQKLNLEEMTPLHILPAGAVLGNAALKKALGFDAHHYCDTFCYCTNTFYIRF